MNFIKITIVATIEYTIKHNPLALSETIHAGFSFARTPSNDNRPHKKKPTQTTNIIKIPSIIPPIKETPRHGNIARYLTRTLPLRLKMIKLLPVLNFYYVSGRVSPTASASSPRTSASPPSGFFSFIGFKNSEKIGGALGPLANQLFLPRIHHHLLTCSV